MNQVLVDTSVWVAHFRLSNPVLRWLLATDTMDKDLAELAARLGVLFEAAGIAPPE